MCPAGGKRYRLTLCQENRWRLLAIRMSQLRSVGAYGHETTCRVGTWDHHHHRAACSASLPESGKPNPDALPADPRWLDGAASDLAACMHDDRDDVPATVQEVIAGELPRQVLKFAISLLSRPTRMCLCQGA